MFLLQADLTKALGWDKNACIQNQEIEMEPQTHHTETVTTVFKG